MVLEQLDCYECISMTLQRFIRTRSMTLHLLLFPSRLYSKGRVLGHKRAKRNTRPNTSLIQIEGVATKEDAQFYLGKVCLFF